MITTNVNNKKRFGNFQKHAIATDALEKALKPKVNITVIHAQLYPTFADLYFLFGAEQRRERIPVETLESFIQEDYQIPIGTSGIDLNVAIYLEENLTSICQAYLATGKELAPCTK